MAKGKQTRKKTIKKKDTKSKPSKAFAPHTLIQVVDDNDPLHLGDCGFVISVDDAKVRVQLANSRKKSHVVRTYSPKQLKRIKL